ncbi:VanZ family protein [Natronobacterium lacisalsi]|uniref:VanZ family protein n=1 Tax=Natronobacterium lacisalsi TaxID=229731 RepID=UPI000263118E|nr:VanZ family protein [Halobiforma lacisalsi]
MRWTTTGVVAAAICYWSLVTTPPAFSWPGTGVLLPDPAVTTSGLYATGLERLPRSTHQHALAYATLAVTLGYTLVDDRGLEPREGLVVVLVVAGFGGALEVAQLSHPARVGSPIDAIVNGLGATAVSIWYGLERRVEFVPVTVLPVLRKRSGAAVRFLEQSPDDPGSAGSGETENGTVK